MCSAKLNFEIDTVPGYISFLLCFVCDEKHRVTYFELILIAAAGEHYFFVKTTAQYCRELTIEWIQRAWVKTFHSACIKTIFKCFEIVVKLILHVAARNFVRIPFNVRKLSDDEIELYSILNCFIFFSSHDIPHPRMRWY